MPHPIFADLTILLLLTVTGAVAWRLRGGGVIALGTTQGARIAGAALLGGAVALAAGTWWAALLIPALALGPMLAGWGDFMDMGRTAPKSEEAASPLVRWIGPGRVLHDVLGMSITGTIVLAPAALAAWWIALPGPWPAHWPIFFAGLAFGPIYWWCWRLAPEAGTELAEWVCGGALGLALGLTFAI